MYKYIDGNLTVFVSDSDLYNMVHSGVTNVVKPVADKQSFVLRSTFEGELSVTELEGEDVDVYLAYDSTRL